MKKSSELMTRSKIKMTLIQKNQLHLLQKKLLHHHQFRIKRVIQNSSLKMTLIITKSSLKMMQVNLSQKLQSHRLQSQNLLNLSQNLNSLRQVNRLVVD
nr:MAG TPA: hypothetical protein [Bacteriophage sp.]